VGTYPASDRSAPIDPELSGVYKSPFRYWLRRRPQKTSRIGQSPSTGQPRNLDKLKTARPDTSFLIAFKCMDRDTDPEKSHARDGRSPSAWNFSSGPVRAYPTPHAQSFTTSTATTSCPPPGLRSFLAGRLYGHQASEKTRPCPLVHHAPKCAPPPSTKDPRSSHKVNTSKNFGY